MKTQEIFPHEKFLTKLRVSICAIILINMFVLLIFTWPIAADGQVAGAIIYAMVVAGLGMSGLVLTLLLSGPYYRSLKYEILDDEVIVRAGIITKSVKHVPYRTVTNLVVKRGILDRLFGLGTLNIQTAGMSANSTAAEESLVGLENVQELYETVAAEMRRYRGALSPTQGESEPVVSAPDGDLSAILSELKAIRAVLEKE